MRNRALAAALCCAGIVLPAQYAHGQAASERRVAVSFVVGSDALVGGLLNDAGDTHGHFGTYQVFGHSFGDVFKPTLRIGGEVSRTVTEHTEVFARVTHTSASTGDAVPFAQSTDLGGRTFPSPMATFSEYKSWTFEGGWRWSVVARSAHVRPYVGASGGLAAVDAIAISECCDFAGPNSRLYAASRVPVVAALAGLNVNVASSVAIGIESGFRYDFGLTPDLSDLRDGPFFGFPGSRWSIPLTAVLRARF